NAGIQAYSGETGLLIYNNTFDGGGLDGDFAGPTLDISGGSQVTSLRNNLVTYSRNQENAPGSTRIVGGSGAYLYADYNAFYSPDNDTKTSYDFSGAGAHDPGELAGHPFAGNRIKTDDTRIIESVVDEAKIWERTQKV